MTSRLFDCTLCAHLGEHHVKPRGSTSAKVFIICQAPDNRDVKEQRLLSGPSGELLSLMLDFAEIDEEEIYLTSALKCHTPNNRNGTRPEIRTCYDTWLKQELIKVNPPIILTLGKDAAYTLLKKDDMFEHLKIHTTPGGREILMSKAVLHFIRQGTPTDFIEGVGRKLRSLLDAANKIDAE